MIRFGKIKQNNWERKQNDGKKVPGRIFLLGKGLFLPKGKFGCFGVLLVLWGCRKTVGVA